MPPTPTPVSLHYVSEYDESNKENGQTRKIEIRDHYSWIRLCPEIVGILTAITDDVLGEGFEIYSNSSAKKKKVEFFLKKNEFRQKLYSWLFDILTTGDGFLGKSKVTVAQVKEAIYKYAEENNLQKGDDILKEKLVSVFKQSPDVFSPKRIFNMKSSTIRIVYDVHGNITGYVQGGTGSGSGVVIDSTVNPNDPRYESRAENIPAPGIRFETDEVIHLSLMNLGDSVYGFTPFTSSLNDIASLWYAKDYAGKYFQEDATPNFMFLLEDENPNSDNFKTFVAGLKERKGKGRGNMVFTGKVKVERVNPLNKDMEFQNMVNIFTQRLLMAWSMPPSRVSNLQGNYRGFIESSEGYYKKINRLQELIEEKLNIELFADFGDVEIFFNRAYKRDESREADIINKLVGQPVLTINEGRQYLGKRPLGSEYDIIPEKSGGFNPTGTQVGSQNPAQEEIPVEERIQNLSKSLKDLQKSEVKTVSFENFKKIVEHKGAPIHMSNVQYLEDDAQLELRFNDGLSEYKTLIPKEGLDVVAFKSQNLPFAVRLLSIDRGVNLRVSVDGEA